MKKIILSSLLACSTLFAADLVWEKDINTAFGKAQTEHKTVMVMVEGEDCRWCKKMKYRTLGDEIVQNRLANYTVVKVMREDPKALKDLPAINGVPTIFFMTADKKVIESVVGYYNVEDFISYIGDVEKKTSTKEVK